MLSQLERDLRDLSPAMAEGFQRWEENPANLGRTVRECLEQLMAEVRDRRTNLKLGRLLARWRLPHVRLPDITGGTRRGLPAPLLRTLGALGWVEHGHTLVITGPSGAGKSYLATALACEALLADKTVEWLRVPQWLEDLHERQPAQQRSRVNRLSNQDLVVLDDLGVEPMTATQAHLLRRLVDARHSAKKATLVLSPVPPEEWDGRFADDTANEAICRRLLSGTHKVALTAP